ncbi:MAG: sigma-54-dependent Fis family transcriptional regulator [Gemmatimonadetes bacterium]|nr:sigma-54-dependent Fis family transcriptional regulator [Gemmatimonadota bacterium]
MLANSVGQSRSLSLLHEASTLLDEASDASTSMRPILEALSRHMDVECATLTVLNRRTSEILVHEAIGLSADQRERGRYRLGEGITGRVVQTGEPVVVPSIAAEPLFLGRARPLKDRPEREMAFVCVPVRLDNETIGALSAERPYGLDFEFDEDIRILSILASLIAHVVRVGQFAEEEKALMDENRRLRRELADRYRPSNVVGNSREMEPVYEMIGQVAQSDATVLIRGESGTGKELIANALHYGSRRSGGPFVRINCAALPESLIESELFGHEKGSFSGAVQQKEGRFERASGGTIFLDEIGDLKNSVQLRLLRVLQEREFERVGGTKVLTADVRVVAATNRPLERDMEDGRFRADLYYRLNVFPIHVPPLRDRRTDIILLADHFIEKYSRRHDRSIVRLSTPAIDLLMAYHWPGNVRELENAIERAVLLADGKVIHARLLPPSLQMAKIDDGRSGPLNVQLAVLEKELIVDALKMNKGNRAAAARQLGLTERIMGLRVEKYGLT